jgi:hypothetical protein
MKSLGKGTRRVRRPFDGRQVDIRGEAIQVGRIPMNERLNGGKSDLLDGHTVKDVDKAVHVTKQKLGGRNFEPESFLGHFFSRMWDRQ